MAFLTFYFTRTTRKGVIVRPAAVWRVMILLSLPPRLLVVVNVNSIVSYSQKRDKHSGARQSRPTVLRRSGCGDQSTDCLVVDVRRQKYFVNQQRTIHLLFYGQDQRSADWNCSRPGADIHESDIWIASVRIYTAEIHGRCRPCYSTVPDKKLCR